VKQDDDDPAAAPKRAEMKKQKDALVEALVRKGRAVVERNMTAGSLAHFPGVFCFLVFVAMLYLLGPEPRVLFGGTTVKRARGVCCSIINNLRIPVFISTSLHILTVSARDGLRDTSKHPQPVATNH
jgi:hypothetical protein